MSGVEHHESKSPRTRRLLVRRKNKVTNEANILPALGPKRVVVARKIRPGQVLQLNQKPGGTVRMPSSRNVLSLPESLVRNSLTGTQSGVSTSIDDLSADRKVVFGDVGEFQESYRSRQAVGEHEDERCEQARQISLYRQRLRDVKEGRRKERQRDREELSTLLCGERILATREERVFRRWEKMNRVWDLNKAMLSKRVGKEESELRMEQSEDFRKRIEELDLISKATPLHKKFGRHYWQMTLREAGSKYVQVGNIFSGLYCRVKHSPREFSETVRRHRVYRNGIRPKSPKVSKWKSEETFLKRKRELHNQIDEMRPHEVTEVDGLIVQGQDLFELHRCLPDYSSATCYSKKTEPTQQIAVDVVPSLSTPKSSAVSEAAPSPAPKGPSIELLESVLVLETEVGISASGVVHLVNKGTTAVYFNWQMQKPPIPSVVEDGTLFCCSDPSGMLLPDEERTIGFSFLPKANGMFLATMKLATLPNLERGSPLLLLKGTATHKDETQAKREEVLARLEQGALEISMRNIIQDIIGNVRAAEVEPEQRPALFHRLNHQEHGLWYYKDVLDALEELAEEVRLSLKRRARVSARWDFRVATLRNTIEYLKLSNKYMADKFKERLEDLVKKASERPQPNPVDCSHIQCLLDDVIAQMPELRLKAIIETEPHRDKVVDQNSQDPKKEEKAVVPEPKTKGKPTKKGKGKKEEPESKMIESTILSNDDLEARMTDMKSNSSQNFNNLVNDLLSKNFNLFSSFETLPQTQKMKERIDLIKCEGMKDDIPLLVFGERQEAPITARIKATSVYAGPNFSVLFTGNRQMFKWNNIQNIPEHEEAVDIANEEQPKPNFKRPGDVEDNFQTTPLPVFENNNIRSIACSDTEILAVHQSGDIVSLSLKDGFMSFECENEDISVIKLCGSVRIAVNTSGSVLTWSDANCSALGRESVQVDSDSSEEIPPAASLPTALNGVSDVKDVACGSSHVLALLKDGQVLSWGSNSHGQLGRDSETEEQSIPAKIEFDSEIVVKSIDAAGNHSIVMADNGTVYTFGESSNGLLGLGKDIGDQKKPTKMQGLRAIQVSASSMLNAAVTEQGDIYIWGKRYMKGPHEIQPPPKQSDDVKESPAAPELDEGVNFVPVRVPLPSRQKATRVVAGSQHSFIFLRS